MRRVLPLVCVFAVGLALGYLVQNRPERGHKSTPAQSPEMITVAYPDPSARDGRALREVHVVQVKTGQIPDNQSVVAPATDPGKTWVITFGKYGEPGWQSFVAVAP